ncbi:PREDICTED: dehydrogenase/reductase SDR family member 13-like isoform X2 [Cyprinodon variegatus]|uniref:dehydrogenase/reductase SDR family member 13-like isoform X2 n=1 Tax=Cyprinodon variegatus TaxID=28743 RepID=UPI000742AD68|nr:PREDICTED: dehydrogenase/reductase SDR family member 13-like isoform X2 [Cyprinodon variegatus]
MFSILLVPGLIALAYIFRQVVVIGKSCKSNAKLHGKTVIITGSNTGIGKATAIEMAKRGARVILACRSKQRGEAALQDVKRESGSNKVVFMQLDLGSLKSVHSFAENFLKSEPRLDILINNAGLIAFGRTENGFGMMFGVNHLGHFLLTNLLLDRLKECGPSRVVNVSSGLHKLGKIGFDYLNTNKDLGLGTSLLDRFRIYGSSKLCNVLFTHELAKRLQETKVTCYSLHPGVIKTELNRNTNSILKIIIKIIGGLLMKNPTQGSQTTLYCALQEGIEHLSGCYFSNCTAKEVLAKAKDDATAKKLWEISQRFCNL